MNVDLYWVEGAYPGRVGVAGRPGGGTWLPDYMAGFRSGGVDILVTALATEELRELSLEGLSEAAADAGVSHYHFPIPNMGVPPLDVALPFLTELASAVEQGANVAAHCFGGIGRSPLIAASVLALRGVEPEDAWRMIERARGRQTPDTTVQRAWVAGMLAHRDALTPRQL